MIVSIGLSHFFVTYQGCSKLFFHLLRLKLLTLFLDISTLSRSRWASHFKTIMINIFLRGCIKAAFLSPQIIRRCLFNKRYCHYWICILKGRLYKLLGLTNCTRWFQQRIQSIKKTGNLLSISCLYPFKLMMAITLLAIAVLQLLLLFLAFPSFPISQALRM